MISALACESAEAALAIMLIGGRDIGVIFADIRLPGVMDGVDLAREMKMRWPRLTVILTSGHASASARCRWVSITCRNRGGRSISLWPLNRR
jgi:DNA-binding NtrC family response regulator